MPGQASRFQASSDRVAAFTEELGPVPTILKVFGALIMAFHGLIAVGGTTALAMKGASAFIILLFVVPLMGNLVFAAVGYGIHHGRKIAVYALLLLGGLVAIPVGLSLVAFDVGSTPWLVALASLAGMALLYLPPIVVGIFRKWDPPEGGLSFGQIIKVISACVFALLVGLNFLGAELASDDGKAEILYSIRDHGLYIENEEYVDGLLELAHEEAFNAAYSYGSKRKEATFDEYKYRKRVLRAMSQRANGEGRNEIARWLRDPAEYERRRLEAEESSYADDKGADEADEDETSAAEEAAYREADARESAARAQAIEAATEILGDLMESSQKRVDAVHQLATHGVIVDQTENAFNALGPALHDEDEAVRIAAAAAFEKIGATPGTKADARILEHLGSALKSDTSVDVRRASAAALGLLSDLEGLVAVSFEALSAALDGDTDPRVRLETVRSVKRLLPETVEFSSGQKTRTKITGVLSSSLATVLMDDTNSNVRREAALALGHVDVEPGPIVALALRQAAESDVDPRVQRAAKASLESMEARAD